MKVLDCISLGSLRDYTPSSVTLKTTYDELFILGKEKAMIRPNFEVEEWRGKNSNYFCKDSRCEYKSKGILGTSTFTV